MKRKKLPATSYWPGYVDALVNVVLNVLFFVGLMAVGLVTINIEALSSYKGAKQAQDLRNISEGHMLLAALGIFRFIKYETGSDTITDFNLGDGDKIDLRGLLADTGFSLDKLSLYLNLSGDLSQQTLKVDTLGSGNFGSPDLTVVMSNPSGINDGLSTLIDQRVFMV